MLLRKYVFLLPAAVHRACRNNNIPDIEMTDIFILYSIDYLPAPKQQAILRHAKRMRHTITQGSISQRTRYLISINVVTCDDTGILSLSPSGKDILSRIRRYLLNKRL